MKICIDATRFVIENAGIARYIKNIVAFLAHVTAPGDELCFIVTFMRHYARKDEKIAWLKKYGSVHVHIIPGKWKEYFWEKKWAGIYFKRWFSGCDVLFAPSYFELPVFTALPSVVVIYDLTTARFPKQRGEQLSARLTRLTRQAANRADAVCAISKQTKDDLVTYCSIDPAKITVTLLACDPAFTHTQTKRTNTLLTVGTLEPRKNLITIIKAFQKLPDNLLKTWRLLIVGGKGWNDEEILSIISNNRATQSTQLLGFIPDTHLAQLYARAGLFVYIPLFEGFGLPVLEAMTCGAPVITSNVSSLPEVGGDACAYLKDIYDDTKLATMFIQYMTDKTKRDTLSKKGLQRARTSSWDKTARATYSLIRKTHKEHV
ncbi:hypothetical protein COT79_03360 [Candidatus Berkelbacteria bacterium CG10_big_fil_rev_8_21_14_0_10_43_14]|uniref:Glycosyltransferase family 1 protein n=1 Tax=Candidatus Berkelbacteria bacterium CG10_big_fil_rev_8_21_14_0_10_43_14 TaxID=1974515 RepID=A0A2M6R7L3_9BACT|nr:MAG: hypothetical protein COT79_03360 [Candidatus Berkelbacteria bacterium CG10_big_fil_rev_8_21_14_0_10_43_14]